MRRVSRRSGSPSGAREGSSTSCGGDDDGAWSGYAQVAAAGTPVPSPSSSSTPPRRRQGHGRALLDAAARRGARSVWAHGAPAAAEAPRARRALGLDLRSLHLMRRPLTDADAAGRLRLPEGFSVRTFEPGRDDEAWVRSTRRPSPGIRSRAR